MTGHRHSMSQLIALFILAGIPRTALAESPGCAQARLIVAEVEEMYASGAPDHEQILQRLALARDLCTSLGEAWKYSHCSAQALGREKDARFYGDKALFLGIKSLSCEPGNGGSAKARGPDTKLGPVRAKYALVIGISKFKDPKITSLQYAAKDARDVAALLQDPQWGRFDAANVTLLTDEQATRANILKSLQQLILRAEEDDLVFLYVSSHGSPHRGQPNDLRTIGYIVTYDAAYDSIYVEGLKYEDFSQNVSLIRARRKAVFLDTCYSGQASGPGGKALFIEPVGVDPQTAKLFLSGEGSYVVTSSRANEQSFESDSLQNSYFTHFLLQALRKPEAPPIQEIFSLLVREVPAAVARDKGQPQHPEMVPADSAGDLRIGVAPTPQ